MAGTAFRDSGLRFFVAGAAFGDSVLTFYVAGTAFGDSVLAVFVAGAAFGDSALAVFVAGAACSDSALAFFVAFQLFLGFSFLAAFFSKKSTVNSIYVTRKREQRQFFFYHASTWTRGCKPKMNETCLTHDQENQNALKNCLKKRKRMLKA